MQQFDTVRLMMRPLRAEDEALYLACYTDPLLMKHIADPLKQETALRSFKAAINENSGGSIRRRTWIMQEKESGIGIGLLALIFDQVNQKPMHAEMGVIIFDCFQNKGYVSEVTVALADVTFKQTDLAAIHVHHKTDNKAVGIVAERLGFQREISPATDKTGCFWVLHRIRWQALRANI